MADPNWNWLDPRAWLWALCGVVGLVLALPIYLFGLVASMFTKGTK